MWIYNRFPQLFSDVEVIVNLSIVYNHQLIISRSHGLVAIGRKIKDGETGMPEQYLIVLIASLVIGATMVNTLQRQGIQRKFRTKTANYSAHD